jgi:hypothetical protein
LIAQTSGLQNKKKNKKTSEKANIKQKKTQSKTKKTQTAEQGETGRDRNSAVCAGRALTSFRNHITDSRTVCDPLRRRPSRSNAKYDISCSQCLTEPLFDRKAVKSDSDRVSETSFGQ